MFRYLIKQNIGKSLTVLSLTSVFKYIYKQCRCFCVADYKNYWLNISK